MQLPWLYCYCFRNSFCNCVMELRLYGKLFDIYVSHNMTFVLKVLLQLVSLWMHISWTRLNDFANKVICIIWVTDTAKLVVAGCSCANVIVISDYIKKGNSPLPFLPLIFSFHFFATEQFRSIFQATLPLLTVRI